MIEYITTDDFSECQRLFHGRGYAYPNLNHINIDWFSPVILITLYQAVEHDWLMQQAQALQGLLPACRSVQVQHRYRRFAPMELLILWSSRW